jgi:hypothetical protein
MRHQSLQCSPIFCQSGKGMTNHEYSITAPPKVGWEKDQINSMKQINSLNHLVKPMQNVSLPFLSKMGFFPL